MDYATYQQRVLARASHCWYNEKLDIEDLQEALKEFIESGNRLDRVKKALMYGRDFQYIEGQENIPVQAPCPIPNERDQRLIHAMLGVATEGVEMMEAVQRFFFGDTDYEGVKCVDSVPFDEVNLQEEFGDTEWYRAFGLSELNQTHEENIRQNDDKLEKRYGSTFTEEAANNRNLNTERKVLEGDDATSTQS